MEKISTLLASFTQDLAAQVQRKFDVAFQEKLTQRLLDILPEFRPSELLSYASRILIVTVQGSDEKKAYLDADPNNPGSGTFLFSYSDSLNIEMKGDKLVATIG